MKMSFACKSFLVLSVALALASISAQAQNTAPVVDLNGVSKVVSKAVKEPTAAVGDSYYQSQMLQNEVRELRGMVEQLSYELQRVKQRQMDDYLDIDRRLSGLTSGAASAPAPATGDTQTQVEPADTVVPLIEPAGVAVAKTIPTVVERVEEPLVNSEEIAENYAQASNLLLKKRDFNGAVLAFKQHITDYPASPYIANAHYWLGEIYLLQGQDELARQAFTMVVEQYSTHGKAQDANFKLGKIYHQLGEVERARLLLETAAKGAGGAANKAQSYLKSNF